MSYSHNMIIFRLLIYVTLFYASALFAQTEKKPPAYQYNQNTLLIMTHAYGYDPAQTKAAKDLIKDILQHQGRVFINYDSESDKDLKQYLEETYSVFIKSAQLILHKSGRGHMCGEVDNKDVLIKLGKKLQLTQNTNIYLIGNALECCLSASLVGTLGAVHFSDLKPPPVIHIDLDLSNHAASSLDNTDGSLNLESYKKFVKEELDYLVESRIESAENGLIDVFIQYYARDGTLSQTWTRESDLPDYVIQLFYSGLGKDE